MCAINMYENVIFALKSIEKEIMTKYSIMMTIALLALPAMAAMATNLSEDKSGTDWEYVNGADEGDWIRIKAFSESVKDGCVIENTYTLNGELCVVKQIGNGTASVRVNPASSISLCPSITIKADAEICANAFKSWSKVKTLTMEVETPPSLGKDALPENLEKIIVPAGMASTYGEAKGWSEYKELIEDVNGVKATAIGDLREAVDISVKGRVIEVGEATRIIVTDMTGRRTDYGIAKRCEIGKSGVYVVSAGNRTKKIVVR